MNYSLHKPSDSPFYKVFFRIPDPDNPGELKQVGRSTKTETKKDAHEKAREIIEATLKEAGAGDQKSREIYALLKNAADLAVAGNLNEPQGREILSEMLRISSGKGLKVYTVREWLAAWLADKEKANARGTFVRYQGVVNQFLDFLPDERADGNLMNLTAEDIREFRDAEHASGKSPNTVNDAVKTIRTTLNKAKRSQVILWNPADAVESLTEDEIEKAVFTPANLQKLLDVAESDWQGVILAGYYTGANLRDITNLRWSQIDLAGETIFYKRTKTGKPVKMPIHSELADWLLELPSGDNPKAFVFPSLAGKSTAGKSGLSMKFGRLMKKAGLKGEAIAPAEAENGDKTKGRTRNTLTFHSLRHSFNSAMANAGVPVEIRNKLTGHSSARMNENYTHMELETYRNAVKTVPGIAELEKEGSTNE